MSEISLNIDESKGISYYRLTDNDGKVIFTDELRSIKDSFEYLSFIAGNISGIVIKCYDKNEEFLYDAYFEPSSCSIYKK